MYNIYVIIYMYLYTYIYIRIYTHVYAHIYLYTHTYLLAYICIYTLTYTYVYIRMYMHIYIYIHIHIHITQYPVHPCSSRPHPHLPTYSRFLFLKKKFSFSHMLLLEISSKKSWAHCSTVCYHLLRFIY